MFDVRKCKFSLMRTRRWCGRSENVASIIINENLLVIFFWSRVAKSSILTHLTLEKIFIISCISPIFHRENKSTKFSVVLRELTTQEWRKIELLIDQHEKESGNFSWNRKSRTLTANKTEEKNGSRTFFFWCSVRNCFTYETEVTWICARFISAIEIGFKFELAQQIFHSKSKHWGCENQFQPLICLEFASKWNFESVSFAQQTEKLRIVQHLITISWLQLGNSVEN